MTTLPEADMPKVSIRRLLTRLAALALTTGVVMPAAAASTIDDAELTADMPVDREHIDELDAAAALGRGLALALAEMRPLDATQLASTWALSEHPVRRLAVAHALEWTFKLVGDDLIIDHLSRDKDPVIRKEIARAAWVRRAAGGDPNVLVRLADDPDPQVRAVARRARPEYGPGTA
jgi:hypothetical protein